MVLALKLILTPLLIALATLAGRRWGPGVSGWFVGLPLTSGPISFILAWQNGSPFAARAAVGTLGGIASVCLFCLAYAWLSTRLGWPAASGLAVAVFLLSAALWNALSLPLLLTIVILAATIAGTLALMPRRAASAAVPVTPKWDIPMRMAIATGFVLALTAASTALGPRLSGLISPFPIFGVVLAAFSHGTAGAASAARVMRGMVIGSLGFGGFFIVVATLLGPWSVAGAYLLATAVALGINGLTLKAAQG
ncbi:MAG TPA: hypothetical protein VL359_06490 [bacterium]|nr:hypothetical protein [bacterium]